jgi:hypothetical protein
MTHRLRQTDELTYGDLRAIEHLTAAADTMRGAILLGVTDRDARTAALTLVTQALGAAVRGVTIG